MSSNSLKLIFLCILVTFFNIETSKAEVATVLAAFCRDDRSSDNSPYQMNLRTLLSSLSSKASDKGFYNDTVLATNSSDTVYGLFMCRGDVLSHGCKDCVASATETLYSNCNMSKYGVMWYEACMVRYSNVSFFSTVGLSPKFYGSNIAISPPPQQADS
ncbi:unnamed protein product [Sphenostylis stenocarpa]|uniref:Gnk2-homologous domain-containing protein n=1 Tax=Sphenostylis stenocarpa TaxID=92480 RepID=A0AA86RZT2_9FABA|nr:unnamed protein product [Sphenostylis stenocarpa]